ncbi:MAG: glycosyltransferase, partial [Bacteroidota bacterium]
IKRSTICLIPHVRSEHTDTTIPNKLFDYMAIGKPIVASNCLPLERIIRAEKCGVIFRSGDDEDLSRKVMYLLGSSEGETYGANGRKAVRATYNWEQDSRVVLMVIGNMSRQVGRSAGARGEV